MKKSTGEDRKGDGHVLKNPNHKLIFLERFCHGCFYFLIVYLYSCFPTTQSLLWRVPLAVETGCCVVGVDGGLKTWKKKKNFGNVTPIVL